MWCDAVKTMYELLNGEVHPQISHYHAIAARGNKEQLCVVLMQNISRSYNSK
jgi:hypothetical protein